MKPWAAEQDLSFLFPERILYDATLCRSKKGCIFALFWQDFISDWTINSGEASR
jgi:hypothetical protein